MFVIWKYNITFAFVNLSLQNLVLKFMNTNIKHCGIVDDISDRCIKVRIVQSSACASCKVASHCNASESKEKIVEVYNDNTNLFSVGDTVVVIATQKAGLFAVSLSSIAPLFLLMVTLITVFTITNNEVYAALTSIGVLIPYYITLYIFKDRIRSQLSFKIEHTTRSTDISTN